MISASAQPSHSNHRRSRLAIYLAISAFVHLAAFYLFQIIYPPAVSLQPPSAQIAVLNPKIPEQRALLNWAELNDPAAVIAPALSSPELKHLFPVYQPSFADLTPSPLPFPTEESKPEVRIPHLFPDDLTAVSRRRPLIPQGPRAFQSFLQLGSSLAGRLAGQVPNPPSSDSEGDPTIFWVGVGPSGQIDYHFLWRSSGNDALDRKGEEHLRRLRFNPGVSIIWDRVTYHWGEPGVQ